MSNLNQVQLIGRVGKEPEVKTLQGGSQVANFSMATSEKWADKSTGEVKEKVEWHNITVFGKLVDIVQKYVFKGQLLFVQGRLQTRSWEKDGITRYITDVLVNQMQMLSKRDTVPAASAQAPPQQPAQSAQQPAAGSDEEQNDLPF